MSYLEDFLRTIQTNNYQEFLKLWEEYCYSENVDENEVIEILTAVKNSTLAEKFGNHVDRILPLWETLKDSEKKDIIIELVFDIETTNTDTLADVAYNYLKDKFGSDKFFNEKIRLVGLRSKDKFQKAISGYKLLSHLDIGNFVFHTAGWGTGEILDLSLVREEMTLEFEYVVGERHLTFEKALNTLIPLPDTHFLAQRFGNPDELEAKAKKNPIEVITLVLKDLGPKTAAELKEELCELVIPEKDWAKWWQSARNKIKKSTKIYSPSDIQKPFELRKENITHEEILYQTLEKKPSISQTISIVYSFIRDYPETLKNSEFVTNLHNKLSDLISYNEISDSQKVQIFFLLDSLVKDSKYIDMAKEKIKETENISSLLTDIDIITFKKKIFYYVQHVKENWVDIFIEEFFDIKENIIRDFLLNELIKTKNIDRLKEKLITLLENPILHPKVYVWYFQKLLKKEKNLPLSDDKYKNKFFEGFMILLSFIYGKAEYKELSKKMSHMLTDKRFELVREFMAKATIEEVKEFLLLSTKCQILSSHEIKIMHSLAEVVFPTLKKLRKNMDTNEPVIEIIWCTKEGYTKTHEKLKQISTVETVKNAQEIEEARSHGDLRENAEYKAALEKRDRLQAEIKLLSDQINKAQILTKNDVNPNKAGVGTIVTCNKSDNSKITFTILGPWEANPEKSILSFQSKLAQTMSNMEIGDKFSYQDEQYTITNISSIFE